MHQHNIKFIYHEFKNGVSATSFMYLEQFWSNSKVAPFSMIRSRENSNFERKH